MIRSTPALGPGGRVGTEKGVPPSSVGPGVDTSHRTDVCQAIGHLVGEVLGAGSGESAVEFWGIMQAGCQTAITEN